MDGGNGRGRFGGRVTAITEMEEKLRKRTNDLKMLRNERKVVLLTTKSRFLFIPSMYKDSYVHLEAN